MIVPVLGLIIGVMIGVYTPFEIPYAYAPYTAIAILACMDAALNGFKALLKNNFDVHVFFTTFIGDAALAIFITYIGTGLNIALDLVAILIYGTRVFQSLTSIRKILVPTNQ